MKGKIKEISYTTSSTEIFQLWNSNYQMEQVVRSKKFLDDEKMRIIIKVGI